MSPKLFNILLVLTPLVLYYGYLDPMYNGGSGLVWTPESNISSLKSQNVQYTNVLNQISLIENEVGKLNKDYQSVDKEAREKAEILLPDSIDQIKLRNEVVSIADKSGVAISGLQVSNGCKGYTGTELACYQVNFSVRSHYATFKKLMENYEKNKRLFILNSVSIVKEEKKDGSASVSIIDDPEMLSINLTFRVFSIITK